MALSATFINNMQSAKEENVQTYIGKNVRKNKRCWDSSDKENLFLNAKKVKTSSEKHINSNALVVSISTNEYEKYHPSSKCHSSVNLKSAEMHPISSKKKPHQRSILLPAKLHYLIFYLLLTKISHQLLQRILHSYN